MDPVAICNMALGWLGHNRITSFEDASAEAELCSDNFEAAVRAALADRAWLFATGFRVLEPSAASPRADLPLKWTVPGDVVAVRAVDDGVGDFSVKFLKAGQAIYTEDTGTTSIIVEVTEYHGNPALWDPNFVRCVAALLASDLAVPLTEGTAMQERMEKKYIRELDKAGRIESMQASPKQLKVIKASLKNVR